VKAIHSAAVLLLDADVDTDQIIPARLLPERPAPGLAGALFRDRRDADPGFALDAPGMAGRRVLVTGPNFGCGSSREAAAWALRAAGVEALLGTSFGATFAANCAANGLIPAVLARRDHARLVQLLGAEPDAPLIVTLEPAQIAAGPLELRYRLDPALRAVLTGRDELVELLELRPAVERYERSARLHPAAASRLAAAAKASSARR
jgi:3-isopropylmalate/(R)-2-methylmalate dehydratase small subunit